MDRTPRISKERKYLVPETGLDRVLSDVVDDDDVSEAVPNSPHTKINRKESKDNIMAPKKQPATVNKGDGKQGQRRSERNSGKSGKGSSPKKSPGAGTTKKRKTTNSGDTVAPDDKIKKENTDDEEDGNEKVVSTPNAPIAEVFPPVPTAPFLPVGK